MYNLYTISLNTSTVNLVGMCPAKITFNPANYLSLNNNLIYQISYNFNNTQFQDIVYTKYPSSYNLDNIYPLQTTVEYVINNIGTYFCYISVYEIGTAVNVITATITLTSNNSLDLYILKSSIYNVKNDTLYVLENEQIDSNLILPMHLNWENKKTQYIDPLQYPTPTPTPTISLSKTATPTPTKTSTPTPSITLSSTTTPTVTPTATPTLTPTPSITVTSSATPTITPTITPTPTNTPSQTLPRSIISDVRYSYRGTGVFRYSINIPTNSSFELTYNVGQVPDKINILSFADDIIYTTGWVGQDSYNNQLSWYNEGPVEGPSAGKFTITNNTSADYIIVEIKSVISSSRGEFIVQML